MKTTKQATENSACVVGALAPYNHGLPLAGTEYTEREAVFSVISVFSVANWLFEE
jgi:hypothetical protein